MIQPLAKPDMVLLAQVLTKEIKKDIDILVTKIESLEQKNNKLDEVILALKQKDLEQDEAIKRNTDKNIVQDELLNEETNDGVDL